MANTVNMCQTSSPGQEPQGPLWLRSQATDRDIRGDRRPRVIERRQAS